MKSLNDEGSNLNNWLGFSLSSQMKMEANSHFTQPPPTSTIAPNFFNTNSAPIFAIGESSDFHMPLKSDGSLCIMDALSRSHSQGMVANSSSPKLEDFLGAPSMAAHQYDVVSRNSMALTLDTSFYNQEQFRQQQNYFSNYNIYQTTNEQHHQFPIMSEEEIPCFKSWMDHHHSLEQQVNHNHTSMVESLSLSMSPGSQSSCITASRQISPTETNECVAIETKKRGAAMLGQKQTVHRKSIDTFGQRTSQYRGVTRHRWTGRYEAHLWDNSCKKEGQTRKGRQVYLGGYDMEEKAARAYDLAALKYWGPSTHINFTLENYHQELEDMKNMSRQEYVAHLRRKSSGFSRGASMYRGVTRHHQHGRWQARIGRVAGNKDLYLGTFSTQEEAAEAYDIAAIKFRGVNAVTNFDSSRYDVEKIMASNTLPTGEIARRIKSNTENAVVLHESPAEPHEHLNLGSHPNPTFDVGLHDLIGNQNIADESTATAMASVHFSNASSLVTSLSSSREESPDRYGAVALFAKPDELAVKFLCPNGNGWIPARPMRAVPPLAAAELPVFAAWNNS